LVWAAIVLGFVIAVKASAMAGIAADMVEKWGSWFMGLIVLFVGKAYASQKAN